MSPHLEFPSRAEGVALHNRLAVAHEAAAANDLCEAYFAVLVGWLEHHYPRVDPDLRESAATDALLGYLAQPEQFDPARADLAVYLRMASRRDLLNLIARQRRHVFVELDEAHGNYPQTWSEPSQILEDDEERSRRQAGFDRLRRECSADEARVLELLLAGERATERYAEALGVRNLPADEQERAVKRVKDRLKKRIFREHAHDEST